MNHFEELRILENNSPMARTSAECPFFIVMPPCLENPDNWVEMASHLPIKPPLLKKLMESGFSPVNMKQFAKKTIIDMFEGISVPEVSLIDPDYGLLMFPYPNAIGNFSLEQKSIARYAKKIPLIAVNKSSILDIGRIRGHMFYYGSVPEKLDLINLKVRSREDLDDIVQILANNIIGTNCEIWFRGQTSNHYVSNLEDIAASVCPWRNVTDISLVPLLYRNHKDQIKNIELYIEKIAELNSYADWMRRDLDIAPYTVRTNDNSINKLPPAWDDYCIEFTVTSTNGNGDLIEKHDYHEAFNGLQAALYLQHYGIDSNVLDITKNLDVALFFAQNKIKNDKYVKIDNNNSPSLYIFILDKTLDRFLDSKILYEEHNLLRPLRQECGLLTGSSCITKNHYSRYISLKIDLTDDIYTCQNDPQYLFPEEKTDDFLLRLNNFCTTERFKHLKPFSLEL